MIYFTGDIHGRYDRFWNENLKKMRLELSEGDYIIVTGDVAICWKRDNSFEEKCNFFREKKWTLLWVQGNHENYDMIEEYPMEEWHSGKVRHIVRDKVILLERGQVFEIEGHTFFTFGGASSHDIQGGVLDKDDPDYMEACMKAIESRLPFRVLHESWWPQELPSQEEMEEGLRNLAKVDFKVDYVITHCCATNLQKVIDPVPEGSYQPDVLTDYLQQIEDKLTYRQWYFGHYHDDWQVDEKHMMLYHGILPLGGNEDDLHMLPVLGWPRYQIGDKVMFQINEIQKVGKIFVVDDYSASLQDEEPSYDILVEEENCICKHIVESMVIGKVKEVTIQPSG